MPEKEALQEKVARLWHEATTGLGPDTLEDAWSCAEELVRILEENAPQKYRARDGETPSLGAALGLLAHIEYLRQNHERSEWLYRRSLEELRAAGSGGVPLARALLSYAMPLIEDGRTEEAERILAEAIENMAPAASTLDAEALEMLTVASDRALRIEAHDLARRALTKGIEALEEAAGGARDRAVFYLKLSHLRLATDGAEAAIAPAEAALSTARDGELSGLEVATVALNLADVLQRTKRYDEALALADEGLGLADGSPGILYDANRIRGIVDASAGRWKESAEAFERALEGAIAAFGQGSRQSLHLHRQLASLLSELGRHRQALPHRRILVAAAAARYGEDSEEFASELAALGLDYDQTGTYGDAVQAFERVRQIRGRLFGETHPEVLLMRFNLAEIARAQGDLETAARGFARLEEIERGLGREDSSLMARILTSYGLTLSSLERLDEAAERLEAARRLVQVQHGEADPRHARVVMAQGQLELARGDLAAASTAFEAAIEGFDGIAGTEASMLISRLGLAISRMHAKPGERTREAVVAVARQYAEQAGPDDPAAAANWRHVAVELVRNGDLDRAREALEQIGDTTTRELIEAVRSLSERRLRETIDHLRLFEYLYLSLLSAKPEPTPESLRLACDTLIRTRGAETTAIRLRGRSFLMDDPAEQQRRIQELRDKVVRLQLGPGGPQRDADLARYGEELERSEALLAGRTGLARLDQEFVPPPSAEILAALPADTAVIEVTLFGPIRAGARDFFVEGSRYGAFVLRGGAEEVEFVDLGPTAEIDGLIDRFRSAVISGTKRIANRSETDWYTPGAELVELVIDRLRPELGDARRVIFVPEGRLGLLPLGCLPLAEDRFLHEELEITYRFSSRRLGRTFWLEEDLGLGSDPAVIGAPDYGLPGDGEADEAAEIDSLLGQFRSAGRFEPLEQSLDEVVEIAELLGVQAVVGEEALEARVRKLQSPEVLHLSTHGFYLPEEDLESPAGVAGGERLDGRRSLADPLERCGLAFAGANSHLDGASLPAGADDGILYASEVAGLQLMRTDLVTLSACQTGVGEVRHGDGVHGLQRAFITAGARSVVCSLWEVPDNPTRKLFTGLYGRLLAGEGRAEALRGVVRELAAEYPFHPVAWGGFVLYGETTPLGRFVPVRQLTVASVSLGGLGRETAPGSPLQQAEHLLATGRHRFAEGDTEGAIGTLDTALARTDLPESLRGEILYERAGMYRLTGRFAEAQQDYDALERLDRVRETLRSAALFDRATAYLLAGERQQAIEAYTALLEMPTLSIEGRAQALVNRGGALLEIGDEAGGLRDLAEVLDTRGMPPEQRAKARLVRAERRRHQGRYDEVLTDTWAAVEEIEVQPTDLANAHIIAGLALKALDRQAEAAERLRRALAVEGAPEQTLALAGRLLAELES